MFLRAPSGGMAAWQLPIASGAPLAKLKCFLQISWPPWGSWACGSCHGRVEACELAAVAKRLGDLPYGIGDMEGGALF